MFCHACGKQLPDDAQFCTACGAKISAFSTAPDSRAALSQPRKSSEKPKTPSNHLLKILLGISCAAVVILAVLLFIQREKDQQVPLEATIQSGAPALQTGNDAADPFESTSTPTDSNAVEAAPTDSNTATLPNPVAFFQLAEDEVSVESDGFMFYLQGDAVFALEDYAELLMTSPYALDSKDSPWTLELSEDYEMGGYLLVDPRWEDCVARVLWLYFPQFDFTQVQIHYDSTEAAQAPSLTWCDVDAYSKEVTALNFLASHTTVLEDTERRAESSSEDAPSSSSNSSSGHDWSFSNQCISCGGSGTCRACGGTGSVYEVLPGTTERVSVNCTSCYVPGKCRDCGGTGKR